MAGKSPAQVRSSQAELPTPAVLRDRGEADRASAVLLGWSSPRIAEFGVREDTVRLWRSGIVRGGALLRDRSRPSGTDAACGATPLLEVPVADRHNWDACAPDR
jgi:hypothetical protein